MGEKLENAARSSLIRLSRTRVRSPGRREATSKEAADSHGRYLRVGCLQAADAFIQQMSSSSRCHRVGCLQADVFKQQMSSSRMSSCSRCLQAAAVFTASSRCLHAAVVFKQQMSSSSGCLQAADVFKQQMSSSSRCLQAADVFKQQVSSVPADVLKQQTRVFKRQI